MELQALLVLCGVGVAGVAVVLLMGLFSASGTSYEEAIAQQRRATNELLALADNKNKSKKTNKKANKKLAKKEKKENATAATGSEIDSEAPVESGVDDDSVPTKPHVEFNPEVVVELPSETPNIKIAEKKEEVSEKKETKTNKQAKGKAQKQSEPIKEELAREQKNNGDAPQEQRKAKKVEKKAEIVSEEVVLPLNPPQPSELTTEKLLKQVQAASASAPAPAPVSAPAPASAPAPSPPPKNKKKKAEQNVLALIAGEGGGVSVGELVRVVRDAALSRTEIQILTEALLNKHHDPLPQHSEWTEGPNDPIQKMKKQLADKEKALADEIEASQGLHVKLKELRAGLNAERGRAAAVGRAAEGAAAAARAELASLQARVQRLADDNHVLAQDKLVLQAKLNEEGEAQAQRVQMEIHIQRLTESEAALVAQLAALQEHAADIAQQLQDSNRAYGELEAQWQTAIREQRLAEQEVRDLVLRHLNATELKHEIAHLKTRAQTAETNVEQLKEESEKEKQELSKEIASLREQLSERESELAELKQLKAAPAHNGLPPTSATDEQKAAELAKVESVVEALRNELSSAQKSSGEQKEQLSALQEQLAAYKDKNNEAIEKAQEQHFNEVANVLRKAYPAAAPNSNPSKEWLHIFTENLKKDLENKDTEKKQVEKELSSKLVEKDNERKQLETELLKKLQEKELVVREIEKNAKDQLQKRTKELENKLQERESQSQKKVAKEATTERVEARDDSRLDSLTTQNEQLQALVDKYKRIIDDTEGALARLQGQAAREEQRWAQQLSDQRRALDALRASTLQQMQSKIDSLEAELQKYQSKNHSSNFADAERLTEEKLMAGFCSKQDTDVHNGPLQVSL